MESSSNVASGNVFPFAAKGSGLCPPAAEADVSPPAAEANGLDANGHPQRKKQRCAPELAQPGAACSLIMPRALVPYQKSLTRSINARGVHPGSINVSGDLAYDESLFDVADDLTDDRFRLKCAFDDLVQWRTRKSLPEFDKT
jgi:hypothetical protein